MAFEGVTLDIISGNAIFTSNLTDKLLQTRCLKSIKERHEQTAFIQELKTRQWFTKEMQSEIEMFFERMNNRF